MFKILIGKVCSENKQGSPASDVLGTLVASYHHTRRDPPSPSPPETPESAWQQQHESARRLGQPRPATSAMWRQQNSITITIVSTLHTISYILTIAIDIYRDAALAVFWLSSRERWHMEKPAQNLAYTWDLAYRLPYWESANSLRFLWTALSIECAELSIESAPFYRMAGFLGIPRTKCKGTSLGNFLAIYGLFNCVTSCVKVLGFDRFR